MQKIIALQKEHSLTLPDKFQFKYARIAFSADSMQIEFEAVSTYLSRTWKEGEFYRDALALLLDVEDSRISAEEICTGKPTGAMCWKELEGHPRCYVWDNHYYEDQTVTWSGTCAGGKAHGEGSLIWSKSDNRSTGSGRLRKGKARGHWVWRYSNGEVSEGAYVDGIRHGNWKYQDRDGRQDEGSYVDSKKHGPWKSVTGPAPYYINPTWMVLRTVSFMESMSCVRDQRVRRQCPSAENSREERSRGIGIMIIRMMVEWSQGDG